MKLNSIIGIIVIAVTSAVTETNAATMISLRGNAVTGGNAGTVNSNLNASALVGPAGGLGTTWNLATDFTVTNMLDSTGAATGINFTTTHSERRGKSSLSSGELEIARSYMQFFGKGDDVTVTFSGFAPGSTHDIWLVSLAPGDGTEGARGTWSTTNTTTSASSQILDGSVRNATTFVAGQNFTYFQNVQATAGGEIVFFGDAYDGDNGISEPNATQDNEHRLQLNGFQIVAIPEPSSIALLGLGGLALILRRRR
ncbi:MAG: PEP-CTERM sorting domain-containing protein [Akkermansiaceae bacterium]